MSLRTNHTYFRKRKGAAESGSAPDHQLNFGRNEIADRSQSLIHLGSVLAAAHSRIGLAAAGAAAHGAHVLHDLACLHTGLHSFLAADSQEAELIAIERGQNSNHGCILIPEHVAGLAQLSLAVRTLTGPTALAEFSI